MLPPKSRPCSPSAGLAATASISTRGSTSSAATARSAPRARAISRAAGPRRSLLLPPPLRGRVGEGGPQRRFEFGAPPPLTPPRKGEGNGGSLREARKKTPGKVLKANSPP